LRYFIIIFTLFFIGCNDSASDKQNIQNSNSNVIEKKEPIEIAKFPNLIFKEKNNTIFYETNSTNILLFTDDSKLSTAQIEELNKSKRTFYLIKNKKIMDYFGINSFPTIIILDKNSSKKYEGFVPNEVLKYELKD